MKPFTFMTVVLGLILGFLFAARTTVVSSPQQVVPTSVVASAILIEDEDENEDDSEVRAEREEAEGLPVPIVPGTRVTEAEIKPPKQPSVLSAPPSPSKPKVRSAPRGIAYRHVSTDRSIAGLLSATEERARDSARLQLEREVTEWLTPEVPTSWTPPVHLITAMIRKTEVKSIVKDYATVYEATVDADFSTGRRDAIRAAYQRELVAQRLAILAGGLGFILVCLAALAGYIRADEATKGYYTHWLRVLAAASVGASGVLIWQFLT